MRTSDRWLCAGFCDLKVDKTVCAGHEPECPSWNNNFSQNLLDGNFACDQLTAACLCQPSESYCGSPRKGSLRVITDGNRHTATPCSIGRRGLGSGGYSELFAASPAAVVCGRSHGGRPCNFSRAAPPSGLLGDVKGPLKCP